METFRKRLRDVSRVSAPFHESQKIEHAFKTMKFFVATGKNYRGRRVAETSTRSEILIISRILQSCKISFLFIFVFCFKVFMSRCLARQEIDG